MKNKTAGTYIDGALEYSAGNLRKYSSSNPLKRKLICLLQTKIIKKINHYGVMPIRTMLDAGCGEGFLTSILAQNYAEAEVIGVEYTLEALEEAKKRFDGCEFRQGDITNLSDVDNAFDVSVCSEVFKHLEKPEDALEELLRVTKHILVVTVPYEPWFRLTNFLSFNHVRSFGNPEGHINHWSMTSFNKFIETTIEKVGGASIEYMGISFPWIVVVVRQLEI